MKVYLVQHAKAFEKSENPERPVTEEGKKEIVKVVSLITKKKPIELDKIYQSGKTRSTETAKLLAQFIQPAEWIYESEDLEPLADPSKWADRIRKMKKDTMFVGHLPHLSKLASLLLTKNETETEIIKFSNAGVVCLSKEKEDDDFRIEWIVTPNMLP